jgi:hypothetical protein
MNLLLLKRAVDPQDANELALCIGLPGGADGWNFLGSCYIPDEVNPHFVKVL